MSFEVTTSFSSVFSLDFSSVISLGFSSVFSSDFSSDFVSDFSSIFVTISLLSFNNGSSGILIGSKIISIGIDCVNEDISSDINVT